MRVRRREDFLAWRLPETEEEFLDLDNYPEWLRENMPEDVDNIFVDGCIRVFVYENRYYGRAHPGDWIVYDDRPLENVVVEVCDDPTFRQFYEEVE